MRLLQELAQLESAQLVRTVPDTDVTYVFRHTLVQETAYGSLLVRSRREVHRQTALCYEQLHDGALEEHAALLAYHFGEAGDSERTLKYATMAGDEAFRLDAIAEAIQHYAIALPIAVGAGPSAEGTSLLIHLYTRRGRTLELSGQYETALANYAEMADLARKRSDPRLELAGLLALTTARTALTPLQDLGLASELSEQALAAARELDDPVAEAKILWNRSLIGFFMGRPGQAVADGEQAIAIARRLGLREQLAYALHDLHRSYIALGQIDRGQAALAEAQALWRELDNKHLLADSLNSTVDLYAMQGDYQRALAVADQSAVLSREIGNRWGLAYTSMLRGFIYSELGETQSALASLDESLTWAQVSGFFLPLVVSRLISAVVYDAIGARTHAAEEIATAAAVARAQLPQVLPGILAVLALQQLAAGDLAAAAETSRQSLVGIAFDAATVASLAFTAPTLWLADIEIRLASGEPQTALDAAERLLSDVRRFGIIAFLPDVLFAKGRVLVALARVDDAWAALAQARDEAQRMSCTRLLWRIAGAMADLADRRGDSIAAQGLVIEAYQAIAHIAEHTGSEDLRQTFLGLTGVQAVLGRVPHDG